jgi:hypothetical protein
MAAPDPFKDLFLDRIKARCPGSNVPIMRELWAEGANEFFDDTGIWEEVLGPIGLTAKRTTYSMGPAAGKARILRLAIAWVDDRQLRDSEWVSPSPGDIQLNYAPGTGKLKVLAQLQPSHQGEGIPMDLAAEWFEGLLHATLARLYSVPGTPYSSPILAKSSQAAYRGQVVKGRNTRITRHRVIYSQPAGFGLDGRTTRGLLGPPP